MGEPAPDGARFADALIMTVVLLGLAMAYEWFKQRALQEMKAATDRLEKEVAEHERTRVRLEGVKRQLVESARWAGMAEVAAGVLHNVGNALNHVTTSVALLSERVPRLRVEGLERAAARLKTLAGKGSGGEDLLAQYLQGLAKALKKEREAMRAEVEGLRAGLAQISAIVTTQQRYTSHIDEEETVDLKQAVEDVLRLETQSLEARGVRVVADLEAVPPTILSKHKFLLVLVNLLHNAADAVRTNPDGQRQVTIRLSRPHPDGIHVAVSDNGVGIDDEARPRVFQHGFTTKVDGHGFGLHSSALAAAEINGRLTFDSAGRNRGATFVLELPWRAAEPPRDGAARTA